MISNPIHVIDADLTISGERYSDIKVWFLAFGRKDDGSVDADDFFRKLPTLLQSQYGCLAEYWKWMSFDPIERNKHVADYLYEASGFPELAANNLLMPVNDETVSNRYQFDTVN